MLGEILIRLYRNKYNEEKSNLVFCVIYFNCHLTMFVTKINQNHFEATLGKPIEGFVNGNEINALFSLIVS